MRTNIVLDDELVEEALRLTGLKTKRELVHKALEALVRAQRRKRLSDLEGRIRFHDGYDHKALRTSGS